MERQSPNTTQKALAINMDSSIYGTLAEIGAGQETARTFFRVGGAAGTIAKSMSAYDMTFSDSIYGPADRYVSRVRLRTMLDHEFDLLTERLAATRGDHTRFFAFANTVAARSYRGTHECHGWLGVRFQREPLGPQHEVIVHVRMFDPENLQQQEALGHIGVNLIHAAFHYSDDPYRFLDALFDDLSPDRIEADLTLFSGGDFEKYDNRLINVDLVRKGYTRSIVIAPNGSVLQAADLFYKHPLLIERGNFRPVTRVNLEMLKNARGAFVDTLVKPSGEIVEVMEITLRNLLSSGDLDTRDFLSRIEILAALGKTVMISNYGEFYRLTAYLRLCTHEQIGIVLGVALMQEVFDEKYYKDLDGGILESVGRLFKQDVRLFVYPSLSTDGETVLTADNLEVAPHLVHLLAHLRLNKNIHGLSSANPRPIDSGSRNVLEKIQAGDPSWETLVTPEVAELIRSRGYFRWES